MAAEDSTSSKTCTVCGETKPIDVFAREGDRRRNQCKACRAAQLRARMANETPEHRAARLQSVKDYAARNADRLREYKIAYCQANADKVKQYHVDRYRNDESFRAAALERAAERRRNNPDRKLEANRRWAEANPDKVRASAGASKAKRRRKPTYRVHHNIGSQMRNALRGRKRGRWESIVGYTVADLVAHLERQFVKGMTWDNYGVVWQIDHITPQAAFDLEGADMVTVRACWALPNLRPLWAKENASKRDRITHLL